MVNVKQKPSRLKVVLKKGFTEPCASQTRPRSWGVQSNTSASGLDGKGKSAVLGLLRLFYTMSVEEKDVVLKKFTLAVDKGGGRR